MKAFFVTGTDTGVGKTVVTSAIAAYCSLKKHLDVGVMKPFESGLPAASGDHSGGDASRLKEASGSGDALSVIRPYVFEAPLAPEAAAERERVEIDIAVVDAVYRRLAQSHDVLLVEGAGGILAPIRRDFFFIDLVKQWKVPVVIVARLGLGTINHTLLTCRYLLHEGVAVVGVVLNDTDRKADPAKGHNTEMLSRYLDAPLLGVFPHQRGLAGPHPDRERLAGLAGQHLDMRPFFA
jgi:dethiobiotin synthetase